MPDPILQGLGTDPGIIGQGFAPGVPLSIHYWLGEGVKVELQAMTVSGLLGDFAQASVLHRLVPFIKDVGSTDDKTYKTPAVVLYPGVNEQWRDATNLSDDIGYPMAVSLLDSDLDPTANHEKYLAWRQIITERFRHKLFTIAQPSVGFHECLVEPGPIVDWNYWGANGRFLSSFTLRFITRKVRGN